MMKTRLILTTILAIVFYCMYQRDSLQQYEDIHLPMDTPPYNQKIQTGYVIGPWENRPQIPISFSELLTYQRINNYIFSHYNIYAIEIAFVDFGYSSALDIKVWAEEIDIHVIQQLGFHLPNDRIDGINFYLQKSNFKLVARQYIDQVERQTITTFNLTLKQGDTKIDANLTHIMRNDQCFTVVRPKNIITHKCFGGYGSGKANMEHFDIQLKRKRFNVYHLTQNLTRTGLDILRGPGMKWQFVWIIGNGFNKQEFYAQNHTIQIQKWIGLNFGSLNGMGQDFLFWNGKVIPLKGLAYQFDENLLEKDTAVRVLCQQPPMDITLKIFGTHHPVKDMGPILIDMKRAYGFWQGWIEIDGKKHEFNLLEGLIEVSNSIF